MTGTVFSIEEFSTFDGPGMRCTVFMKGCPLRCQWCHNPEGQLFEPQILRSPNGCLGCGTCVRTGMTEESISLCPRHLLRKCGKEYTPEALVESLESTLNILAMMGGGITFSGGEPLSQSDFVLSCLKLLEGRIHRAVQTSGYCSEEVFREILRNTDYVLFDLKLLDDEKHRHFTGVSNDRILKNYQLLAASGVEFITRIPLIPGVNDTAENLEATARFMAACGVKRIELLPYNKAAGAKYKAVGREYAVDFDGSVQPRPHEEIFSQYDIEVHVL